MHSESLNCIACSNREPYPLCTKCLAKRVKQLAAAAWQQGNRIDVPQTASAQLLTAMKLSPDLYMIADGTKYTHASARLLLNAASLKPPAATVTSKWDTSSKLFARTHATKWGMCFDTEGHVLRRCSPLNMHDLKSMLERLTDLGSQGASIRDIVVEYDDAYLDLHRSIVDNLVNQHEGHVWSMVKPARRHQHKRQRR